MKRRTFVVAVGVPLAGLVDYAWPASVCAGLKETGVSGGTAFALVDPHLARSRELARLATRAGMPVVETGDDIGMLWHTTLGPRLAGERASFIGVVRASDAFVLARLAGGACRVAQRVAGRQCGSVEVWMEAASERANPRMKKQRPTATPFET
ncbi:hypothetical protein [Paraburkholderia sp.]|uniref:hypothetical protein n=1 Tax=Paraburkholderia sp. TaxID=1926495 RepID=UPI003D6EBBDA